MNFYLSELDSMELKFRQFARRTRWCQLTMHKEDMYEFAREHYCVATQRSSAVEHMRAADLDGDGKIEEDEFLLWHAKITRQWPSIGVEFTTQYDSFTPNFSDAKVFAHLK